MIKEAPRYFIDIVIKKPHTGYITYAVFEVNRWGKLFSLVQQLFYRYVFTLFALLVEEQDEGDTAELELLLQIAPFTTSDVNMLALDVVGFKE